MTYLSPRPQRRQNRPKTAKVYREKAGFDAGQLALLRKAAARAGKSLSLFISEATMAAVVESHDLHHLGLVRMPGQIDTDLLALLGSLAWARRVTVDALVMQIVYDWVTKNPSEKVSL